MKRFINLMVCLSMLFFTGNAFAASITMSGDYVLTAVSTNGTLGAGGTSYPGIRHDPTGTGSFPTEDYLTPGTPWEMFSVESDQTGLRVNNNTSPLGGGMSTISLTDLSASSSYDQYVSYLGTAGAFDIQHDTYFNDGDERISIRTTITANTDLSGLKFARALDPDPDVYSGGGYATINGRGYDSNGDGDYNDAGDLAPEDWVHAEGPSSGLTIGLYTNSSVDHNTAVTNWTYDPDTYLSGAMGCTGCDWTIGLAFNIGLLSAGSSIVLDYAYVMGDSLENVDIPPVPEPSTIILLGSGLAGLMFFRRKRA